MMMRNTTAFIVFSLIAFPTVAEKPVWAESGQPTAEQKEAPVKAMEERDGLEMLRNEKLENREQEREEKIKKENGNRRGYVSHGDGKTGFEELKGFDKQREKKSEQIQKELGKGSQEGEASRETRRKWWRFWEQ